MLQSLIKKKNVNELLKQFTVLSLINAPGALQFFKRRQVYKRQVFNAKMQCLSLFTMTHRREI